MVRRPRRKRSVKTSHLKYFSSTNVKVQSGPETNPDLPAWQHTHAGRNAALQSTAEGIPLPKTKGIVMGTLSLNSSVPRVVALLKFWQGLQRQGFDGYHFIVRLHTNYKTIKLCFGVNQGAQEWFYICEDRQRCVIQHSLIYNSRYHADLVFPKKIVWIEEISFVPKPSGP